ncbi:epidermal growth factor-like protein 7 [Malaya genurostris]|uniref:epidermal growth factor-like protein 7 n=1 Tax=Malaya genurostris TaxID=325434 RepID=UPI0026F39713|nr:epidermal growth factor-like protein 7 [Malaya genurostris]
MGKLRNKSLLAVMAVVVISTIGCQAYQHSGSDYSETLTQQPEKRLVHRHHSHHQRQHQQHRLNSISLGHRNSSRYSLIGPSSTGNDYPAAQLIHNYHLHQSAGNIGHQQNGWHHHRTSASDHSNHPPSNSNQGFRWKPAAVATTTSRPINSAGNTAGVRHVKRMLKHNNHHHRNMTGKNVCTEKRIVQVPVYRKSTVKHFVQPCLDQKLCTGIRTNYEPTYHSVKKEIYICCSGWKTTTTIADGCLSPICRSECRNGGRCTAPDTCSCPAGFTGSQCEEDINECKQHKPCDQTCYNTEGSYYCTCRDGFILQADRQSCRRDETINDVAIEARDMENDVDYDSLDTRLTKLEKIIFSDDRRSQSENHELNKKVQYALDAVSALRSQISRLSQRLYPTVNYGTRLN